MGQREMNQCALQELHQAELRLDMLLKRLGITKDSPERKGLAGSLRSSAAARLIEPCRARRRKTAIAFGVAAGDEHAAAGQRSYSRKEARGSQGPGDFPEGAVSLVVQL